MTKNKFLRSIIFALAIVLAISLAGLVFPLFMKGWNVISNPSVNSIVEGLNSQSESERSAALDKIVYPLWFESEIIRAISEMALDDSFPYLQSRAIGLAGSGYSRYSHLTREELEKAEEKPVLTPEKIVQIANQVLVERVDSSGLTQRNPIYDPLYVFLQNTINAQSNTDVYIDHITNMLDELLKAERFYERMAMIRNALQALKAYSKNLDMPEQTIEVLLDARKDEELSRYADSEMIVDIFYNLSSRKVLNKEVTQAVEEAAVNNKNKRLKTVAIMALGQQSLFTGRLSKTLEYATNDEDQHVAQLASQMIARFKQEQGRQTGQGNEVLLATALDTRQQPDVRASALMRGVSVSGGKLTIVPEFFNAAETLFNDPEPVVRAASVTYLRYMWNHELYQNRQDEIRNWLERGLEDPDALVRRTAVNVLEYYPDNNAQRSEYIVNRLKDDERQIVVDAMRIISIKKLNTPAIVNKLETLTHSNNNEIRYNAERYHKRLLAENRNIFEDVVLAITDPESRGGLLYIATVILAIVLAAGFAIYYAYTLVSHIVNKRKTAIHSVIVLVLWVSTSYVVAGVLIASLFGMGHNTPAPIEQQMAITFRVSGIVLVYGFAGFIMSLFVRVPKPDFNKN